jgi:hypothetical protein
VTAEAHAVDVKREHARLDPTQRLLDVGVDPATIADALDPAERSLDDLRKLIAAVPRTGSVPSRWPLLNEVDLGAVMRAGDTAPQMLTDRLVLGLPHLWYGAKQSGKTWVALHEVRELLLRRETVCWIDKEMERTAMADRTPASAGSASASTRSTTRSSAP